MLAYVIQGIGYGFAAGTQPGPFQTYVISQTLRRGWRRALSLAFAPLISDGPIIALVLLILTRVPDWMQQILYLASGLFILYLAYGAFRSWQRDEPVADPQVEPEHRGGLLKAALMNALSPGPYIYWSLITGPILVSGWQQQPRLAIGFLLGFYAAMIATVWAVILVFGTARAAGPRLTRILLGLSVVALAGFGLYQLWQGLRLILPGMGLG